MEDLPQRSMDSLGEPLLVLDPDMPAGSGNHVLFRRFEVDSEEATHPLRPGSHWLRDLTVADIPPRNAPRDFKVGGKL